MSQLKNLISEPTNDESDPLKTLREDMAQKLLIMKSRNVSYYPFRDKAERLGLPRSNGMVGTANLVRKFSNGDYATVLKAVNQLIDNTLESHIRYFNKKTYIFQLTFEQLSIIEQALVTHQHIGDHCLAGNEALLNPYLIDGQIRESSLVESLSDTLKIFYFKKVRGYFEKVDESSKASMFSSKTGKVVHVFKIVQHDVSAFDFLALDFKNMILVIGMDLCSLFKPEEINIDYEKIRQLVYRSSKLTLSPINLQPCVKKLESESSGNVVNHDFASGGGGFTYSGKTSSTQTDARLDPFYSNGANGQLLDFYGVAKGYAIGSAEHPIITIKMSLREYKRTQFSPIYSAILDDVQTASGFQFCLDKIMQHVN